MDTKTVEITKETINLTDGSKRLWKATVTNVQDAKHKIYSLTYDGYRSQWMEVQP